MLTCVRPMPLNSPNPPPTRESLRANDTLRCLCGQPTCRDVDVKPEEK
jgi:hypothetical protein